MIRSSELKRFACRYHRNGIAGHGFYLCRFTWRGDYLQAVLFPGDESLTKDSGRCAVLDPADMHSGWRGDEFEPAIRALILAYGDKAFADHQGKSPAPSAPALATPPRSKD